MAQLEPIGNFKEINIEKLKTSQIQAEEENYFVQNSSNETVNDFVVDDEEEKFSFKIFLEETIHSIKEFFGFEDMNYENSGYDVNGEIDKDFQQGLLGDCSLLGTLYSISNTEVGAKVIKDAITINKDSYGRVESYSVNFKGIDEKVTITKEELEKADKIQRSEGYSYTDGDDDVLLMELAWVKCNQEAKDKLNKLNLNMYFLGFKHDDREHIVEELEGVDPAKFSYALTGAEIQGNFYRDAYRYVQAREKAPEVLEIFENQKEFKFKEVFGHDETYTIDDFEFNQKDTYEILQKPSETSDNVIMVKNKRTNAVASYDAQRLAEKFAGCKLTQETKDLIFEEGYRRALEADYLTLNVNMSEEKTIEMVDINGDTRHLTTAHCFGVKYIDEDKIVISNPHNTQIEMIFSKEELKRNSDKFEFYNFESTD